MQSPLSALCEVLKEVRTLAKDHPPQNETHTRIMLIDPVLKALGWDIANPHLVEVEKHLESVRNPRYADYILKVKAPLKPIIVEAKKLGDLLDNKEQILYYAHRVQSESIFLTDGLKWHHFTNFDASNLTSEIKDLGTTSDSDLPLLAAYLVENLDAALFADPASVETVEDELRNRIDELEKMIIEVEGTVSRLIEGIVTPPIIKPELEPWLVLGDGRWDPKSKRPKKLRLPDNSEIAVGGWSKVLTEICIYCLTNKPELLDPLPILDKAGRNTKLVDTTSSTGNCAQVTIKDQVYFVNVLYSASASVANAVYMLEKLGVGTAAKVAVLLAE